MTELSERGTLKKGAFQLIIFLGVISLLGDIIYETARGVSGQYLNIMGVNATTVGFIVGLGELLGYGIRVISGHLADRTKSYWLFTGIGYGLLISIPLISFTSSWQIVAILIIMERIGKGIRSPARDTIASHAAKQVGTGYGFGIAELIDQIGGIIGPFIFTFALIGATPAENPVTAYRKAFALFWAPYILLLLVFLTARIRFKHSAVFETSLKEDKQSDKGARTFAFYALFVFITSAGSVSFALVGFHLKKFNLLDDAYIPIIYAIVMGIDAIVGIGAGRIYDYLKIRSGMENAGLYTLLAIPIVGSFVPIFVFSKSLSMIISGAILLGFCIGMQETIMKATVADITHISKRSTSYGILHISFGLAFFTGSFVAGLLYDYSISILIISLILIELSAIPVFYKMRGYV